MLYNLNRVLMHSAKGSSWTKHKYIKKVNGKYYYPKNSKAGSDGTKNVKGNEILTKVGNRWYNLDEINAQRAKLDAADKYNEAMRNSNGIRSDLAANYEYGNALKKANAFEKVSNSNLSISTNVIKNVLNTGESAKEFIGRSANAIGKGKENALKFLKSLSPKKKRKAFDNRKNKMR